VRTEDGFHWEGEMRTMIFHTGSVLVTAILKNAFVLPQEYPDHENHLSKQQGGKNKIADVLYLRSRNMDENGNSILGICH
jgi:hypothetical protein